MTYTDVQPQPAAHPVDEATNLRKGTFALGRFTDGVQSFTAIIDASGAVIDISERFADLHAVFDDWSSNLETLGNLWSSATPTTHLADLRPLPPLSHPNLLCAGANYKTHSAQMLTHNKFNQHNRQPGESDDDFFRRNYELMERRSREGTPFFWTGLHSSIVGAHDDVVLPALGDEPDWELELGVVLGGTGRYVTPEEAGELIAGYTIINDLGTVDIFRRTDIPWGYDWVSKHQPTFKPLGPFIVPAQFFALDDTITITLRLNGAVMQNWPANDMIFSPEQFVSYASERVHLTPGDVIAMGSPPGNGKHHDRFLRPGDVMDSEITYLGRQRNRCVAEQAGDRKPTFGHWTNAEEVTVKAFMITELDSPPGIYAVPEPVPGHGEVRVPVLASSVNPADWMIATGGFRAISDYRLPAILGRDFAGIVDQVGVGVSSLALDEAVSGFVKRGYVGDGTFAELVVLPRRTRPVPARPALEIAFPLARPLTRISATAIASAFLAEGRQLPLLKGTVLVNRRSQPVAQNRGVKPTLCHAGATPRLRLREHRPRHCCGP